VNVDVLVIFGVLLDQVTSFGKVMKFMYPNISPFFRLLSLIEYFFLDMTFAVCGMLVKQFCGLCKYLH
jgi:hypothetical protein